MCVALFYEKLTTVRRGCIISRQFHQTLLAKRKSSSTQRSAKKIALQFDQHCLRKQNMPLLLVSILCCLVIKGQSIKQELIDSLVFHLIQMYP